MGTRIIRGPKPRASARGVAHLLREHYFFMEISPFVFNVYDGYLLDEIALEKLGDELENFLMRKPEKGKVLSNSFGSYGEVSGEKGTYYAVADIEYIRKYSKYLGADNCDILCLRKKEHIDAVYQFYWNALYSYDVLAINHEERIKRHKDYIDKKIGIIEKYCDAYFRMYDSGCWQIFSGSQLYLDKLISNSEDSREIKIEHTTLNAQIGTMF